MERSPHLSAIDGRIGVPMQYALSFLWILPSIASVDLAKGDDVFEERRLAALPNDLTIRGFRFAPDGKSFAYVLVLPRQRVILPNQSLNV